MDLIDRIEAIATKIQRTGASLETEEATKNALIMPFISSVLGYDVFDPTEVVPEFTADVGTKKHEKIDYAIKQDDQVMILIEAKKYGEPLTAKHASQLFRYFSVTHARIALLTNGSSFWFYTDLDAPNKMDDKPFMVLELEDLDETLLPELKKMTKGAFDIEAVVSSAGDLKYTSQIKKLISEMAYEPSEDFVKLLTKQVYSGMVTQKILEQFTDITKRAFASFISDRVSARLQSALDGSSNASKVSPEATEAAAADQEDTKVVTTEDEIEGFHIIRALLRNKVEPHRIVHRDTQSYFGVLLDDNNRKPICRLHLNTTQWYIGLFDDQKRETRHPIEDLNDIYSHSNALADRIEKLLAE